MVTAGPYELSTLLGRGGMGEVWLGRHTALGVPAAVKIVRTDADDLPGFRTEVRAMAALDHPNIVRILDHGELPDGRPWFAMERVTDGPLSRGPHPWPVVRRTLLALLDGLAHAHARGLLHRDLKPGNLLVTRDHPGGPPRVLVSDFGIAHPLDPDRLGQARSSGSISGTPSYMAPEQFEDDPRAFGPWTDLYSLGCVAWALVSGTPPYGKRSAQAAMLAHLSGHLPPFPPAAPPGLQDVLRGLLARRPADRYRTCADAAAALLQLPAGDAVDAPAGLGEEQTHVLAELETVVLAGGSARPAPSAAAGVGGDRRPPRAPLVVRWRSAAAPPPPPSWLAAARRLFGLRRGTSVGREAERDRLWAALARVHRNGSPEAVVVRAAPGLGRTHLVGWLSERASELGAAHVLRAGPEDDAPRLLQRWLRTAGLEGEALDHHLRGTVPGELVGVARAVLRPTEPGGVRLDSDADRDRALARILAATTDRPIVVGFDDAHRSIDLLRTASVLASGPAPALVVVTADDSELADLPNERDAIGALDRDPIRLSPLSQSACFELLRGLLPLDGGLESTLVERCGGVPRWLVEVVAHAVLGGDLVPETEGFRLRPGAAVGVDVDAAWRARLDGILIELTPPDQASVELLGALGPAVDRARWTAACAAFGVEPAWSAVDRLVELRLAEVTDGGLRLSHPRVGDALRQRSEDGGRRIELHLACAATASDELDRAMHLAEAGAGEEVLPALARGFDATWKVGGRSRSAVVLAAYERVLDRAVLPGAPSRAAWGARGWVMRSGLLLLSQQQEASLSAAETAVAEALGAGDPAVVALALRARLRVLRSRGRAEEALRDAAACRAWAERCGDDGLVAEVWLEEGNVCSRHGRSDQALSSLRKALELQRARGDEHGVAKVLLALGAALGHAQQLEEAQRVKEECVARFERLGSVWGLAMARNDLAIGLHDAGDRERAHALLVESLRGFESIGHADAAFPRLNLAAESIAAGRYAEARSELDRVIPVFAGRALQALVRVYRIPCLADAREWAALDHEVAEITATLEASGLVDPTVAPLIEPVIPVAERAGRPETAESLRRLGARVAGQGRSS